MFAAEEDDGGGGVGGGAAGHDAQDDSGQMDVTGPPTPPTPEDCQNPVLMTKRDKPEPDKQLTPRSR